MDAVTGFLDSLTVWHWWGLAVILLVAELLTGTTYLLWPTAAAALVGLIAATPLPFGWEAQLVTFATATIAFTLVGDRLVEKHKRATDAPKLNERVEQLRGEKVVAVGPFVAGRGRVRLGDTVWAARLTRDAAVDAGAVLEVEGVDGATLEVKAV